MELNNNKSQFIEDSISHAFNILPTLNKFLKPLTDLSVKFFSSHTIYDDGYGSSLSSHPEIWQYILEKGYHKNNPFFRCHNYIKPGNFIWSTYTKDRFQESFVEDVRQTFNLGHGISFIKRNVDSYTIFNILTDTQNVSFYNQYLNESELFEDAINTMYKNAKELFHLPKDKLLNYANEIGDGFYKNSVFDKGVSRQGLNAMDAIFKMMHPALESDYAIEYIEKEHQTHNVSPGPSASGIIEQCVNKIKNKLHNKKEPQDKKKSASHPLSTPLLYPM